MRKNARVPLAIARFLRSLIATPFLIVPLPIQHCMKSLDRTAAIVTYYRTVLNTFTSPFVVNSILNLKAFNSIFLANCRRQLRYLLLIMKNTIIYINSLRAPTVISWGFLIAGATNTQPMTVRALRLL